MAKSRESSLYHAILTNDLDEVQQFLAEGANPNQTVNHGKTCLGEAASMGNTSIVKLLIDYSKVGMDKVSIHGNLRKRHTKTQKRKMKEEMKYDESIVKCKNVCDASYYIECGKVSSKTEQRNLQQNHGYFILIHSESSSSDESRVQNLMSPVSPSSLTSSPLAELEWDEDIRNVAPPTSEDETWSSMYQWYASILEKSGAAIASASAVTCGINQQDAFMRTALHYATEQGHSDVVKLLVDAGCEIDVPASSGITPLHIAVLWQNTDIMQLLLDAGSNIDHVSHDRLTALHFAASRGYLDVVKILVDRGANLETRDKNQCTPLYLATSAGKEDVVDFLIASGADVNTEEIHGYTAICEAVWEQHPSIVASLIKGGARISHSYRLLHHAVMQHQDAIVRMLADAGGGVNLYNDSGDTPFLTAVRFLAPGCARILLDRGANVNAVNMVTGSNALHLSVECTEQVEDFQRWLHLLLEYGINMNATSLTGDTALNRALLLHEDRSAELLIMHGADVNACDLQSCGLDNLAIASRRAANNLASMLVKAGHTMPVPDNTPVPLKWQGCAASWLHEACRYPLSLLDLCRIRVRQRNELKKQTMEQYIQSLPLPNRLKNFLMMDDEYSYYGSRNVYRE